MKLPLFFTTLTVVTLLLSGCSDQAEVPALPSIQNEHVKYNLYQANNWSSYEGGFDSAHFSELEQINRTNVDQLGLAWSYPSGGSFTNPIVVDGVMYVLGNGAHIEALDAASGRKIWSGPEADPQLRGLSYWQNEDATEKRLLFTRGNYLQAIDASTGKLLNDFGDTGRVDLRLGLERDPESLMFGIAPYTPGRIFEDLIILGSFTGEDYYSPPGDVRAYDVRSGKLVWQFHTIPAPGETGYESWEPAEPRKVHGGANAWGSNFSIDEERGIVYFGLGSATYDYWGGNRKGNNLFANSLVALDVRSGKYLWHFQAVHHDLWDTDLAASPVLVSINKNNRHIDAVAIATKSGFMFVFDRESGEALWPIKEKPVTLDVIDDEWVSPTQPFPTTLPPFVPQFSSVEDILDNIDPDLPAMEKDKVIQRVSAARFKGTFTPLSDTQETILYPGTYGGANWGALAGNPERGRVYVMGRNMPSIMRLSKGAANLIESWLALDKPPFQVGKAVYIDSCASCHGADFQGSPPTIPGLLDVMNTSTVETIVAMVQKGRMPMPAFPLIEGEIMNALLSYLAGNDNAKPGQYYDSPGRQGDELWRTQFGAMDDSHGNSIMTGPKARLVAYDLNKGHIAWEIPVNDTLTGSSTLVTRGGLVFVGSTRGRYIQALDEETGELLWQHELPVGAYGVPSSYAVNGRQYIVVPTSIGYSRGPAPASWNAIVPPGLLSNPADGATAAGEDAHYMVFALSE